MNIERIWCRSIMVERLSNNRVSQTVDNMGSLERSKRFSRQLGGDGSGTGVGRNSEQRASGCSSYMNEQIGDRCPDCGTFVEHGPPRWVEPFGQVAQDMLADKPQVSIEQLGCELE